MKKLYSILLSGNLALLSGCVSLVSIAGCTTNKTHYTVIDALRRFFLRPIDIVYTSKYSTLADPIVQSKIKKRMVEADLKKNGGLGLITSAVADEITFLNPEKTFFIEDDPQRVKIKYKTHEIVVRALEINHKHAMMDLFQSFTKKNPLSVHYLGDNPKKKPKKLTDKVLEAFKQDLKIVAPVGLHPFIDSGIGIDFHGAELPFVGQEKEMVFDYYGWKPHTWVKMDTELESIKKEIAMKSDFNNPLEMKYSNIHTKDEIQEVFRDVFIEKARYTLFPVLKADMLYQFILTSPWSSPEEYLEMGVTTNLSFEVRDKNQKVVLAKQSMPVLRHTHTYKYFKDNLVGKVIDLPTKEKKHVVQSNDPLIKGVLRKNKDLKYVEESDWKKIFFTAIKGKAITRDGEGTLVDVHFGKYESLQLKFKLVEPPTDRV